MTANEAKEEFFRIYTENIQRPGAEDFLSFLETTDFFKAPASDKVHSVYEGGLVAHSVTMYHCLKNAVESKWGKQYNLQFSEETLAVVGLLHDVCRIEHFVASTKMIKNDAGAWVTVPIYVVDDKIPYGHGEKSVYLISDYMRLSEEEAFAIRYHAGYSNQQDSNNLVKAMTKYPLVTLAVMADMEAAFFAEQEGKTS